MFEFVRTSFWAIIDKLTHTLPTHISFDAYPIHYVINRFCCVLFPFSKVKAMRNFDITGMMGFWYMIQYYASSEELPEYGCMRCVFEVDTSQNQRPVQVTMNFTYDYSEDPLKEDLVGNITWIIPDFDAPAHWLHKEAICKAYQTRRSHFPRHTSYAMLCALHAIQTRASITHTYWTRTTILGH